jgi:hypothetical protein
MISGEFFPYTPDMLAHEFHTRVSKAQRDGLKLYVENSGNRAALLPKPIKGWSLFSGSEKPCLSA